MLYTLSWIVELYSSHGANLVFEVSIPSKANTTTMSAPPSSRQQIVAEPSFTSTTLPSRSIKAFVPTASLDPALSPGKIIEITTLPVLLVIVMVVYAILCIRFYNNKSSSDGEIAQQKLSEHVHPHLQVHGKLETKENIKYELHGEGRAYEVDIDHEERAMPAH